MRATGAEMRGQTDSSPRRHYKRGSDHYESKPPPQQHRPVSGAPISSVALRVGEGCDEMPYRAMVVRIGIKDDFWPAKSYLADEDGEKTGGESKVITEVITM